MKTSNKILLALFITATTGATYIKLNEKKIQYTTPSGIQGEYIENKLTLRPDATWFRLNELRIRQDGLDYIMKDFRNKTNILNTIPTDTAHLNDNLELIKIQDPMTLYQQRIPDKSLSKLVRDLTENTKRERLREQERKNEFDKIYREHRKIILDQQKNNKYDQ